MKALLSFGVGSHTELLEIARPSYQAFADLHGYELLIGNDFYGLPGYERPPSWLKIPILIEALHDYEEVLFFGADLVIVDPSEDLNVPWWAWQALVAHHTDDGEVPNADMWFLRRAMIPHLRKIWGMVEFMHHGWWEQRALIELMGYTDQPCRPHEQTDLYIRTFFLDPAFNVHCNDKTPISHPRFQHATMWPDRAAIMREWAQAVSVG